MNEIKIYYSSRHKNLGDAANPLILEKVFGVKGIITHNSKADVYTIGSLLQKLVVPKWNISKRVTEAFKKELVVWTSGFIVPPSSNSVISRKLDVRALRGRLSLKELEKTTGRKYENIAFGDGGLLFKSLLDGETIAKTHTLGIIPHYREREGAMMERIKQRFPDAMIIDVIGDVIPNLRKIASCERILSSSLHGLIAADSFGIPNARLVLSTDITGGDFKYNDYYSAFGLESHTRFTADDILDNSFSLEKSIFPLVTQEMVEKATKSITEAFGK